VPTYYTDGTFHGNSCIVDGLDEPCNMVSTEATVVCPNNVCSGINANGQLVQFWAFAGGGSGYYSLVGPGALYYSAQQATEAAVDFCQPLSEQTVDGKRREYQWKTFEDANEVFSYGGTASPLPCGPTDWCYSDPQSVGIPPGTYYGTEGHTHPWPGRGDSRFAQDIQNNYISGPTYVSTPEGGLFLIELQSGTISSTICQVNAPKQFETINACH
jgi:hypothetical protein